MSKKRKTQLRRGKYYASYPNGGHPSLIYRKNKKKNKYDAVVFGTTPGHHKKELDHPISPSVKQSVIQTRPIRGTRSDFGDRELQGLEINKSDKPKIEMVKRRIPQETRKYREYKEKKRQASKSQLDAVPLLKLIADDKSRKNKTQQAQPTGRNAFRCSCISDALDIAQVSNEVALEQNTRGQNGLTISTKEDKNI